MPYFDPDPVDPELNLKDDIGPGFPNRADDLVKLASAIEWKTGAAPHAELGRYGAALARRFAGRAGERKGDAFSPGFLAAVGAAQIRRGTDPDTVVLKDGPTRDALKSKDGRGAGRTGGNGGFAPLPKIARPVGPTRSNRAPNRPEDARTLQGKLASLGYVPRVTEKPLFPNAAAGRLSTPPFYPSDGRKTADAADSLAGLVVANEVQDQRKAKLAQLKPLSFRPRNPPKNNEKNDRPTIASDGKVSKNPNGFTQIGNSAKSGGKVPGIGQPKILKTSSERHRSIIENGEGKIYVQENKSAKGKAPLHAFPSVGRSQIAIFDRLIEVEARRQRVDPDLVRAIVYVENSQGWYGKPFEAFGVKSYLPMNIRPDIWAPLGFAGKDYLVPKKNIRVGVTLIRRIRDRIEGPTIAKIATLYNSLSQDRVTDYGARVAEVYRRKLWEKKN